MTLLRLDIYIGDHERIAAATGHRSLLDMERVAPGPIRSALREPPSTDGPTIEPSSRLAVL